jgi:acetyl coenzyme A synthetase (ADP forming)-like protein
LIQRHDAWLDVAEDGGVVALRDGTTALIRRALPADQPALADFFARLSPESRWHRFFSETLPRPSYLQFLCQNADPRSALTLVVVRNVAGAPQIIASACYQVRDERTAEAAFAVADEFQGKGLGTLLLEHLALEAARHGFARFWAVTHADNRAMLAVFRESGFACTERPEHNEVEIDLTLAPTEGTSARVAARRRIATVASLRPFFQPKSVALIGASRDPESIGYRLLEALASSGYPGTIYPVNPHAAELRGLRAYPSAGALPAPVELAVIAVPSAAVPRVVDDCAARGIRALLVISAGFAEVGPEGKQRQAALVDKVRGYGMRLIGPNCLGLLSTYPRWPVNLTFAGEFPAPGPVAMSSDSGGLGMAVLAAAARQQLGASHFVSVGNRADVSSNDLLEYWEQDDAVKVIVLYLESLGNARRFSRIARRVSRAKPIVALKGGRTPAGTRAAGSHTAALAARDVAVNALFQQTGVIRAQTLEELLDLAAALGCQPLPEGRRVAIVTNAGGPAILCADACETAGLVVPKLSGRVQEKLAARLSKNASAANPVDMVASATPGDFGNVVQVLCEADEVDALIVLWVEIGSVSTETILKQVWEGAERAGGGRRTILACAMPGPLAPVDKTKQRPPIPCYGFPEAAADVLGKMAAYAEWRRRPTGTIAEFTDMDLSAARAACQAAAREPGPGWLSAEATRAVLGAARFPIGPGGVAASAEAAVSLARAIGFPVAVKLASRTLIHKTELGGVRLNLRDQAAVAEAFAAIKQRLEREGKLAEMDGVLVQPMVAGGTEVMIGMTRDPVFGPLVAFGLGGIFVEILGDVVFRVAPLTDRDAADMVAGVRGRKLFEGYRGHPPADVQAMENLLLRVSFLAEEISEIVELDLNPVFALPPGQGSRIVDARLRVAPVDH